jgi:aspartate racemase
MLKTLGILAGMGPTSTAPFVDLVVQACREQLGAREDAEFPPMMIRSHPVPFFADRPNDLGAIRQRVGEGLAILARSGAEVLAIACNTAHIHHAELAAGSSVPLLDMVSLAVADLPLDARRVALLAARPTVASGIYQRALAGRQIVAVDQTEVDALLTAVRTGGRLPRIAIESADVVLVACLDLSGLLARGALTFDLPVHDAAVSLARALALGARSPTVAD